MRRRGFMWQAGCLATLILLTGAVGLIVLLWHLATAIGLSAGGAGGLAVLTVLALAVLIGAAVAGRAVRRMAMPFGDLIDAAGRIEGGDYTARVPERPAGPPPVRALVRSFNGMTSRLEANERQRRTLLADIGHELRTPLAVLQGELEAMLDGVHPPDAAPGGGPRRDPCAGPPGRRPADPGPGRRRHAGAASRADRPRRPDPGGGALDGCRARHRRRDHRGECGRPAARRTWIRCASARS